MTDFETWKEATRRSYDEMRRALESCNPPAVFKSRTSCTCPKHGDTNASGSICDISGHWTYTCFVPGCGLRGDVFDVMAWRDRISVDALLSRLAKEHTTHRKPTPKPSPPRKPPTVHADLESLKRAALWANREKGSAEIEDVFPYYNPDRWTPDLQTVEQLAPISDLIVLRVRIQKKDGTKDKTVMQAQPVPGGFILKKPEGMTPLYNRVAVRLSQVILFVEGENKVKAAQKVASRTMAVTSGSGGSGNSENIDLTPLAGKAAVYLWPDHDPPKDGIRAGTHHMQTIARRLQELNPPPARILWIDPEAIGLEEDGSDVVDFLAQNGGDTDQTRRDVLAMALEQAKPLDAAAELDQLIEEEIAGLHRTVGFPWACTTRLAKALRPGTVTLLCGDPGSGKSLWLLEALWWILSHKVKVAVYELEEDRNYHLKRVLAQLAEVADLTDPEWVESHPDDARAHMKLHRTTIASLAPCIEDAPDTQLAYRQILQWLETKAAAGARVIAIDPITAIATSDKPWVEDLAFLMAAKSIVRKYRCSLILVTHPRKGRKTPGSSGLEDMAGGAAFPRFAQTMFWLVRFDAPKAVRCSVAGAASFDTTINRAVRIPKARNGPGGGLEIGFAFNPETLRFEEQGVVEEELSEQERARIEQKAPKGVEINWRSAIAGTPEAPQDLNLEDLGI